MSLSAFMQLLAADSTLRDAYVAHLDARIGAENVLERIDGMRSLDHQRGRVAELRHLRQQVLNLDRKGEPS